MSKFRLEIQGLTEAKKLLDTIPKEFSDRVLLDVNKAGAKIVKQEVQNAAANVSGDNDKQAANKIENNILVVRGKSKTSILIGIAKRAFHALFVEKGTKVRKTEKGANRGTMNRKPFVKEAHNQAAPKVITFFSQKFLQIVNRSLKRQAKRFNKK